ncbi:DinB family protein [Lysobacter korlensis]|uniref:DinB family protein n=1 Tax=Lysobacter korlensis TaxID=553636 RepID=A0ABV6RTU3_9GAMM
MTIVPDTKDWTWVLERACPQCGFDASAFAAADVPDRIRADLPAWAARLAEPDARTRPDESTWSALEYGAHVRDVFRLFRVRLALMLNEDDPLFASWDQDATALEDRYDRQDPAAVAGELVAAGEELAADFERVGGAQWHRPGRRSDGARFTVDSFARYFIHDPVHHLWDVTGVRSG